MIVFTRECLGEYVDGEFIMVIELSGVQFGLKSYA